MTSSEQTPIRMSTSAELVEAVPYVLGFHPSESLVALGFRRGRRELGPPTEVAVAARTDLDPHDASGVDEQSATAMLRVLRDADCEAVVVVLFSNRGRAPDPRADPVITRAARTVAGLLETAEIVLLDVLLATDERWWSLRCQDSASCPSAGNQRAGHSLLAAELTYAGLVARPSRECLLATLDGRPEAERARLLPALHRAEQRLSDLLARNGPDRARRTESSALVRAAYECQHATVLSPRRLARLGAALRDLELRDQLWLAVDAQTVTAGALLEQLHMSLPAPYDAAPMFLYGWSSWRAGSGTLATEAAERALRSDPGYSAAQLLIDAVQSGLDPHRTPPLLGRSS